MILQTTAQQSVTLWSFLTTALTSNLFFAFLIIIVLAFVFIFIAMIIKGYNFKGKGFQIGKIKSDTKIITTTERELDTYFGGIETLKDSNDDSVRDKAFHQIREAIQETKNISNDLNSFFIESFSLKDFNEDYYAFDNAMNDLKFKILSEMIDMIFTNHINIEELKWKNKKQKLTKRLTNTITEHITKEVENKRIKMGWVEFDSKFFNRQQSYIKLEMENFIEELRRVGKEHDDKIRLNNDNIERLKRFYKGENKKFENTNN